MRITSRTLGLLVLLLPLAACQISQRPQVAARPTPPEVIEHLQRIVELRRVAFEYVDAQVRGGRASSMDAALSEVELLEAKIRLARARAAQESGG